MLHCLKRTIDRYPYQSFLAIYNLGVFAYIKAIGNSIATAIPTQTQQLQNFLTTLSQNQYLSWIPRLIDMNNIRDFFANSPYRWLVVSLIVSFGLSLLGRLMRFILTVIIVAVGLYLIYVYSKTYGLI